jgi:hypothetical protein
MRDAVALGSILEGEFRSTYDGADKAAYLAALRSWLANLGVVIEGGDDGPVAALPIAGSQSVSAEVVRPGTSVPPAFALKPCAPSRLPAAAACG